MTAVTRAILMMALTGIIAMPLLAGHALIQQLASGAGLRSLGHPDVLALVVLSAVTTVPLGGLFHGMGRWWAASRGLAEITWQGTRCRVGEIEYTRVPGGDVLLFTAGAQRATIYVSEGAEASLCPEVLRAALLHECAHARRRDPLWVALTTFVESALWIAPWTKRTFRGIRLRIECAADDEAVAAGAQRRDLFDAIVAASAYTSTGVGASEVVTMERLQRLTGAERQPIAPPEGTFALLASVTAAPTVAHALVWAGAICSICSTHTA